MSSPTSPELLKRPASAAADFAPSRQGILQRKCACGGTASQGGECEECRKQKRRGPSWGLVDEQVTDHDRGRFSDRGLSPNDTEREFTATWSHRDFGALRIHTENRGVESPRAAGAEPYARGQGVHFADGAPKKKKQPAPASKPVKPTPVKSTSGPEREQECSTKCKGGTYGDTYCDFDLEPPGLLTGKVKKEVYEKSPCTRPCVEEHESVHEKVFLPVCKTARKCLDKVEGNIPEEGKCLDQHADDLNAKKIASECLAYTTEEKCLNKQKEKAVCTTKDGKANWQKHWDLVQCYKACYCKS